MVNFILKKLDELLEYILRFLGYISLFLDVLNIICLNVFM